MPDINSRKQGSRYDKILRENMPLILPGIMKNVLNLNVKDSLPFKDKLLITRQKEVDSLNLVTDAHGKSFLVQIEFESAVKKKMNFRMAEYRAMLHQIYPYPVKQYVIYMGRGKSSVPNKINLPNFKYEYSLINFKELPCELFLSSNEPEEQILAVLANKGSKTSAEIVKAILQKITAASPNDTTDNKYYQQLRVIMQLRKFDNETQEAMLDVNSFWKLERDPLYKRGRQEGESKSRYEMARGMKKEGVHIDVIVKVSKLSKKEIEAL
ncbi:RpnC/YadD family protein [Pedobacter africanus]|uniref:Transposase, YhgA-like n=1 Tax=Pedobacter africanus TaxID=151894 RepID=A0A1W2CU73_9SPHI|nr:hypothetical protein [Pedobacter africanus]SMC88763.1 hypothetical protein SAMN04488524_3236 [Pedobacter africanus]